MNSINRRDFLKLLTKVPEVLAAGAVAATVVTKAEDEIQVMQEGMFKHQGVMYQPIYEYHGFDSGTPLHPNSNGVFIEINTRVMNEEGEVTGNQYTADPDDLFGAINADIPVIYEYYQEIARRKIPIAVGDVILPPELRKDSDLNKEATDADNRDFYNGLAIAVGSVVLPIAGSALLSRRDFLKKAGAVGFLAGVFGLWKSIGTVRFRDETIGKSGEDLSKQYEPVNRVLTRLQGLASDVHPESPAIFMRNLIMARKMKQFGQYLKDKGIEKPIESFSVGLAHNGIEDFLCLPDEISKQMIVYCARDYVNRSLLSYGDFISATRIVEADENGIFKEVDMLYDTELLSALDS